MPNRKKGKASLVILIIIIVIAVGVLGFCAYKLFGIGQSYKQARDAYDAINELFVVDDELEIDYPEATEPETDENGNIIETDEGTSSKIKKTQGFNRWRYDYEKLLTVCPDAVGYIALNGVLEYPILQGENNDTYLRHMYNGEYNMAGSLFVDSACKNALDDQYAIVYGHNMDDGSMFAPVTDYQDEKYYKEHPYFDVFVRDRHYKYYVFAAFPTASDGDVFVTGLTGDQVKEQGDYLRQSGLYKTDAPAITKHSHILVLSTCVDKVNGYRDYSKRFVVCLVRGEQID